MRLEIPKPQRQKTQKNFQKIQRWELLKIHVFQGTFRKATTQTTTSPFDLAVELLWKDVIDTGKEQDSDSTTEFLQNKGMSLPQGPQQRRNQRRAGVIELIQKVEKEIKSKQVRLVQVLERRWGLDGLSLDRVPHCDINNHLYTISNGLLKGTEAISTNKQINLNRAWKLLLIGICQAESFARYEALTFLQKCLPNINQTLFDNKTKADIGKRILEIVKGDERRENRTRALFVLGEWIKEMGNAVDIHGLLKDIVFVLVRQLASIILTRKMGFKKQDDVMIHILKTLQNIMAFSIQGCDVKSIMMYLLYIEMGTIFQCEPANLKPPTVDVFVLLGILDVLVSLPFPQHQHYLGALFHPFITKCQAVPYKPIIKKTLEFICKFLPVSKEESLELGMEVVMTGIRELKKLGGIQIVHSPIEELFWQKELKDWQDIHHKEQIRISLHEMLIRRLVQPPGTVAKLYPISGCHGFFGEMETGMRKAESILVDLPIHAKSLVTVTRVVGQIPGVPMWATTTPPLCISPGSNTGSNPRSLYEYKERIGCLPGLPSGYTYSPGTPMKQEIALNTMKTLQTEPKSQAGLDWTKIYRIEKPEEWETEDDIPSYATRYPLPSKQTEDGGCPYGFTLVCPYPGFDPDKVEKVGFSPIYGKLIKPAFGGGGPQTNALLSPGIGAMGVGVPGKDRVFYQDYTTVGVLDDPKKSHLTPEGLTLNKHPVLFPCKLPGLRSADPEHEFLPRSPVIFDIIQPHQPKLKRILCMVERIDGESSNIVVQKGTGDIGGLYEGATFTMYVKVRGTEKWCVVQLKVLDENYDDGLDSATASGLNSTYGSSNIDNNSNKRPSNVVNGEVYSTPVPVNYTQHGEPFFAPPVTMAPVPVGYNECIVPYFSKTASLKANPLGVSALGNKYYAPMDRKFTPPEMHKHHLAGFDCEGHPFFVPRGMTVPSPSGFTIDGIPFYDIASLIRTQGVFSLTPLLRGDDREPSENEDWCDLGRLLHNQFSGSPLELKRLEAYFVGKLLSSVEQSQPILKKKLLHSKTRQVNPSTRNISKSGYIPPDEPVREPIEISEFLRNSLSFAHLKPHPIRIILEALQSDFHSAKAPITKNIALKFKAGRGDYTEREYFLAVEPANTFSITDFNLKLQGEGFHEIAVTYYPMAMKGAVTEGALHVFDRHGRKMAYSKLVAVKKHFFKVRNEKIELGWVPVNKKKESFIVVENLTEFQISIGVQIEKESPFLIPNLVLKLRPLEIVKMPLFFAPKVSGNFNDKVILLGPGGEEIVVVLRGTTVSPVTVLAEDEVNSRLGMTLLSMERSVMVRKWHNRDYDLPLVSGIELKLIDKIQKASWDLDIRNDLRTIDFGICCVQDKPATRCLTIFNWGKDPLTISLYPHDPTITCPYLIRVAGISACTVEVVFDFNSPKQPNRGNYTSLIELSCYGYDNMFINVKAYIGQPVYFPVYEYTFFKPCRLGQISTLMTTLVNESQYEISCFFVGLDDRIKTSQNISKENPIKIGPFALYPVTFMYRPDMTGPIMNCIRIRIVKPSIDRQFPGSMKDRELHLIGMCIQPRKPNGDYLVHPVAEKLLNWLSQTRGHQVQIPPDFDFSDDLTDIIHVAPDETSEVIFKSDPFITEIAGDFLTAANNLIVQNRSAETKKIRFFSSPGFTLEPRQRDLEPAELLRIDHYFSQPPQAGNLVTMYGFGCLLDTMDSKINATQIIKRLSAGFLLLPAQNYVEQNIVFEFGRIELTNENSEATRYLMLCNPFNTKYNWSIKLAPSARKNMGFDIPMVKGEIQKFETMTVPLKFKADVSGSFETKCDVFVEPFDQISKSVRLGTVVLRGTVLYTKLLGLPETISFGSTIVYHSSKKRINLQNEGASELEIIVLVRAPFALNPQKFSIPAKSNQWVEILFSPTEHKSISSLIQVFANQKLYGVNVSGTGGAAQLICEQYSDKPIDFGLQKDGTIAWMDVFLTNKGTIPLRIIAVMSDQPTRVRVEFNGTTDAFPGEDQTSCYVQKDYWSVIRKKLKVLQFVSQYSKHLKVKRIAAKPTKSTYSKTRKILEVHDVLECDPLSVDLNLVQLAPHMSYHFRIGFLISAKEDLGRELTFSYLPICDDVEPDQFPNLLQSTNLELTGSVFVPLELKSAQLHFGFNPAEAYKDQPSSRNGNKRSTSMVKVKHVKILNKADIPQTIQLDRISPEYSVMGRIWTIKPRELLEIPIEFHPPREQTQYLGEAVFSHRYGSLHVKLDGTGASAELFCDEIIDFGNLKLDTIGTRTLTLYNRGILPCPFEMDIIQSEEDFWFENGDPYEYEGEISNGSLVTKEICCRSRRKGGSSGHISIKWRRIPGGKLEKILVPLKLLIGYPEFRIENPESDFKATFIGINKTLPIRITNDGNAACNWSVLPPKSTLSVNITTGVLEPGDSAILLVTYTPKEYEKLDESVSFSTDAGVVKLLCFGEVGVPYLRIDEKYRKYDFGVVTIGRSHHLHIPITNTGRNPQEFETKWTSMSRDSVPCAMEDLEFYFVEPTHGIIPPGETISLKVTVFAKDYAVGYEAGLCVFTVIGEQHDVHLKAVGGQAIINIQPPRLGRGTNTRNVATPNFETRKAARRVGAGAIPVKEMEATKVLMKSHIDNLFSVIAGLRTAEEELVHTADPVSLTIDRHTENNLEGNKTKTIKSKQLDVRESKQSPHSKAFLETLLKMENEIEEAIAKLDPTGSLSAERILASQAASRAQTASETKSSTPSSHSSSRSFGQYRPGKRILRRSQPSSQGGVGSSGSSGSSGPASEKPLTGVTPMSHRGSGISNLYSQGNVETFDGPIALGPDLSASRPGSNAESFGFSVPATPKDKPPRNMESLDSSRPPRQLAGITKLESLEFSQSGKSQFNLENKIGERTPNLVSNTNEEFLEQETGEDNFDGTFVPQIPKDRKKSTKLRSKTKHIQEKVQQALDIASKLTDDDLDDEFTPDVKKSKKPFDPKLLDPNSVNYPADGTVDPEIIQKQQEAKITIAEVHQTQQEFLDLLSLAQNLGISIDVAKENIESIMQVNYMINSCMENTKNAIKSAKGTLVQETWIPNREVIQQALKKLQISTKAIDSILRGKLQEMHPEDEDVQSTIYSFDLICGGDRSPQTLLFCIPNQGNIPFAYSIEPIEGDRFIPEGSPKADFFSIDNSTGLLQPGDSIDISASFMGFASGTYRQGFALKSGDDEIMTFSLLGVVGNPILSLSADDVDFGLIAKGQSVSKQLVVKNTGTFRGNWEASTVVPTEAENCFIINPNSGRTEVQSESTLVLTFSPTREGPFSANLELIWKDGTCLVPIKGIGGGSKLEFQFDTPEEQQNNAIDFGNTLVGLTYEKHLTMKNIGTLGTILEITHPNRSVTFHADRDEQGDIRLEPGQTKRIRITYSPQKIEKLKDLVAFTLGKPKTGVQSVSLKGKSQTQGWDVEGELDFANLKVGESQEKQLLVKNVGTTNIPLELRLEPASLESSIDISFEGWSTGTPILPEKSVSLRLLAHSNVEQLVEGSLILKSKILNEVQEKRFSIYFRFFTQEVITTITNDVDLGRAVPGERLEATQVISNFGNQKVNYRARLEMPNSGPTDWKIVDSNGYGTLDPNQSVEIRAIFDAISGRGDDWQEAKLIIEKTNMTDHDWTEFSSIGLKAALGIAQFVLEPNVIDFGAVGVGETKTSQLWIKNPGTAICLYQVQENRSNSQEITLGDFPLAGNVGADGQTPFVVSFSPKAAKEYVSDIVFKTSVGEFTLSVYGKALDLRMDPSTIPEYIEFENLMVNETKTFELELINDCTLDLDLQLSVIHDVTKEPTSVIRLQPSEAIIVPRNPEDGPQNTHTVTLECGVLLALDESGVVIPDDFKRFQFFERQKETLTISNNCKSIFYQVPITYKIILPPCILKRTMDGTGPIESVDFGSVNLENGAIKKFFLINPNPFKFRANILSEGEGAKVLVIKKQFTVYPEGEIDIGAKSSTEVTIVFESMMNIDDYPDGPPKMTMYTGNLVFLSSIVQMPEIRLPIKGALVDV